MKKPLLLAFLTLSLYGCAEFQNALVVQNDFNRNIRTSQTRSSVKVIKPLTLTFSRGIITSTFEARLPEGSYAVIAESDGGVFYLAPYGSFVYLNNGSVESRVGGLVRSKQIPSKYLVWFFPYKMDSASWATIASGDWTSQVHPGIAGIASRPWIESDFIVPAGVVRLR